MLTKESVHYLGLFIRRYGSDVRSQKERIGVLEVFQIGGKHIIAEDAVACLLVAAKQRSQMVEILPPAMRIFRIRNDLQQRIHR